MQEVLVLPKPHSRKQKLVMQSMFCENLREIWVASGSKFGKSLAGASCLLSRAFITDNGLFRWVAPIYSQAKIGFKYAKTILPPHLIDINNGNLTLKINEKNTSIEFRSGKYPEDLEGEACHGYCLDECAKMTEQVYDSAKTTTTITRGIMVAFSTPRGKNWFYNKCMSAKEEMEWSLANNIQPSKIFLTAPSSANPYVTKEAIEEARRNTPERLFRQYYLAEFIDQGAVFVGYRDCINEPDKYIDTQNYWLEKDIDKCDIVIGVDWAKHTDYTVFVAIDYKHKPVKVIGYMRFHGISYMQAVKELYLFAKKFKSVSTVWHDKTGVGEALDDMLCNIDLPFHGVTFSNSSKSSLINTLGLTFEKKDIIIPNLSEMLRELDVYEVDVSETGMMRYNAPPGFHDDIVISLALANAASREFAGLDFETRFLDDLKEKDLSIDKFYTDLLEDN